MVYVARFVYGYVDDYGDEILERGRYIMVKKHIAKRFILKHFKFPISIAYSDPMENLPKAIELLLIDMKDNGIDRWNVEEITEEWDLGEPISEPADLTPKEEFEI